MEFLDIGYGNLVSKERIIAVIHPSSAPAKRLIKSSGAIGKLIDASGGSKCESVIIMDSDHVILSSQNITKFSSNN